MNVVQAQNTRVLSYLSRETTGTPVYASRTSVQDPYYGCGCHPDIVERLWDQIGASLPKDCRCLIYGTPALAHPDSGVILAIGIGTQYGLRLPDSLGSDAVKAGARTFTTWTGGGDMDIRRDLGEDWVFGAWLQDELGWCNTAYKALRGQ